MLVIPDNILSGNPDNNYYEDWLLINRLLYRKNMSIEISQKKAQQQLSKMLIGCSINKISYYITGWDLRLIGESGLEYIISASDIKTPNINQWWDSISAPPISLTETNEPEDTITAITIFTVLNKWPICSVEIDEQSNLCIGFENGSAICLLAIVEHVDWTWVIGTTEKTHIITCDTGVLYENV